MAVGGLDRGTVEDQNEQDAGDHARKSCVWSEAVKVRHSAHCSWLYVTFGGTILDAHSAGVNARLGASFQAKAYWFVLSRLLLSNFGCICPPKRFLTTAPGALDIS